MLLVPVVLVLTILVVGIRESPEAASSGGKAFVQVAFTGSFSPGSIGVNSFANYQSVLLNVIAVRFNPTTDMNLPDGDPSWQTVAVNPGVVAGDIFPTLSFGGNFGPNGNPVGVGQARSVMQIDLAQLQNNLTVFNTAKIRAQEYQQVELLLDANPGSVTPVCGTGTDSGEGCITYQTQFPQGFTSIRFPKTTDNPLPNGLYDIPQKITTVIPLAINAILPGGAPVISSDKVQLTAELCPLPSLSSQGISNSVACSFSAGSPPLSATAVAGFVTGQVHGATGNGVVNAELTGTGTVISSATVDSTTKRNYTMILPVGTYDFIGSSPFSHSIDAQSGWVIGPGQQTINFNLKPAGTHNVGGSVVDTCTGIGISGATVQIYGPPTTVGGTNCASPSPAMTPAACVTACDNFSTGAPPAGCVVLASSSTSNLGAYPFSPSGAAKSAFTGLPSKINGKIAHYGLTATASGYNGRLLTMKNPLGTFKCGSGDKDDACSFSLNHGTLEVNMDAGFKVPGPDALNVMVNVEDSQTFNGEAVEMVTIPVGKSGNPAPAPILVPLYEPSPMTPSPTPSPQGTAAMSDAGNDGSAEPFASATKATPTPTGTPVDVGGAPTYDMFASVQDLFGPQPQKVSGHKIAVLSGVAAPAAACTTAIVSGSLTPLTCVGHGSIQGTLTTVDQNTLLSVSKDGVAISLSQVPLIPATQNFSICEPVDNYTITHYETQPTGPPVAQPSASASVSLSGPITIPNTSKAPCFSICSASGVPTPTSSASPTPTSSPSGSPTPTLGQCLLCQNTLTSGFTIP